MVTSFEVRPIQKEKPTSSKIKVKQVTHQKPSTNDYLLNIMPKAVIQVTKKNAIYKKDSKGVYTLSEDKGC